jgi:O-antigen chain-terminating methyltransferase
MAESKLDALVAALPELYQPVYGHPEFDTDASRVASERNEIVLRTIAGLTARLGRAARVLDLGCAQGYLALALAKAGSEVTGVDRSAENVALCNALAAEHPGLNLSFVQADLVEHLRMLEPWRFDVVLLLSVVHHTAHEQGSAAAVALVNALANKVDVVLAETALRAEPVYWAPAQPEDPRDLFREFAFVHSLGEHPTHLSDVRRPLFFASSHWWCLGDDISRFERWTTAAYSAAGDVHGGTRRYYFAPGRIAKHFLFRSASAARNRYELENEGVFLADPPQGMPRLPALESYRIADDHGWLVRSMLPGTLLCTLLAEGKPVYRMKVVTDVLDELCVLEAAGLYHGDVRTWNVLVDEQGTSTLIDYGEITTRAVDCAAPRNLYLSFLVFVHEMHVRRATLSVERPPLVSPGHFEGPMQDWIAALWQSDPESWTFAFMRKLLDDVRDRAAAAVPPVPPDASGTGRLWEGAVESHLAVLGHHQVSVGQKIDRLPMLLANRDAVLEKLLEQANQAQAASAAARGEAAQLLRGNLASEKRRSRQREANMRELDLKRGEIAQAQQALVNLQQELANVQQGLVNVQRELAQARDRIAELTSLHEADVAGRAQSANAYQARTLEMRELSEKSEKSEGTIRELTSLLERERQYAAEVARAHATRVHELEVVYGTISWRLTGPLRKVRRWLRR